MVRFLNFLQKLKEEPERVLPRLHARVPAFRKTDGNVYTPRLFPYMSGNRDALLEFLLAYLAHLRRDRLFVTFSSLTDLV